MIKAEAKVFGRSVKSEDIDGGRDDPASDSELGWLGIAKGLAGVEAEDAEKGFDCAELDVVVENGFAYEELDDSLAPNNVSPILTVGFAACVSALSSVLVLSFLKTFESRTPRNALTLPSLRLQVFRRHDSTYKRLSCPGKNSGRSPFSCRSKTMRSWHVLHLASAADGGMAGSSHS